jgi:hypothetical protein
MAERTGWRDKWISLRHRQYGRALVAEDCDCIIYERDGHRTVAQVEEKHFMALLTTKLPDLIRKPSSTALASHFYLDEDGNAKPRAERSASGAVNVFIAGTGPKVYAEIPAWIAVYWPRLTDGTCAFRIAPLNGKTHRLLGDLDHRRVRNNAYAGIGAVYDLTETEYVERLYAVRGLDQIEPDVELGTWTPKDHLTHIPDSDNDIFQRALFDLPNLTVSGFKDAHHGDDSRRRLEWQLDQFVVARDWLAAGHARRGRNGAVYSLGVRDDLNKTFTDQFWHGAGILAAHALGWRLMRGPGQNWCSSDPGLIPR